jgi:hypothetical protein
LRPEDTGTQGDKKRGSRGKASVNENHGSPEGPGLQGKRKNFTNSGLNGAFTGNPRDKKGLFMWFLRTVPSLKSNGFPFLCCRNTGFCNFFKPETFPALTGFWE